ncbi:MAG: hypothetical protein ACT4QF_01200 [Sporichthyaceae bacterium]
MQEPAVRNVAVLPVLASVAGLAIVLSTLVGQGASATDCGPGRHSMAGMDHGSSSGGSDMAGMDHGQHLAMGGSSGCMDGPAMTPAAESAPTVDRDSMPGMDHDSMPGMDHDSMDHGKATEKAKKPAQSRKATATSGEAKAR